MVHFPPSNNPDSKDPWDTVQHGYDPERFYTRSTNSHDHSVQRSIRLSPALDAVLHHAIERIPAYRTTHDVVRDALVHRLHQLDEFADDHPAFVPLLLEQRQAEIDEMRSLRQQWTAMIESLDRFLGEMIDNGEYDEANELLDRNNDDAMEMAPVYRARLGEVIARRYRQLNEAQQRRLYVVPQHDLRAVGGVGVQPPRG